MEKQLLQVRAFQTAFNAPLPEKPAMLDNKRAQFRQKLLQEEVTELKKATDLEGVADAICDILYVTYGTAHEYGMADRLSFMFDEVHASNMRKMGEDGKPIYQKSGKVAKPEGWTPPNLLTLLNRRYHLFNDENATFAESLQAMNEAESQRWNKYVESEIFKRLSWFDRQKSRFASWLERPIKKKISINNSYDDSYRGTVVITVDGVKTELVDF
jgi:predicted HAD superfamily Cof-like phosphohydrolase